jgi:hypothetical protein
VFKISVISIHKTSGHDQGLQPCDNSTTSAPLSKCLTLIILSTWAITYHCQGLNLCKSSDSFSFLCIGVLYQTVASDSFLDNFLQNSILLQAFTLMEDCHVPSSWSSISHCWRPWSLVLLHAILLRPINCHMSTTCLIQNYGSNYHMSTSQSSMPIVTCLCQLPHVLSRVVDLFHSE